MSLVAVALRSQYEKNFGGGSISYGPNSALFDIGAYLEAGNGKIVTEDHDLAVALEELWGETEPIFKRVDPGDAPVTVLPDARAQAAVVEPSLPDPARDHVVEGYAKLSVDDLRKQVEDRGIPSDPKATKQELAKFLEIDDSTGGDS